MTRVLLLNGPTLGTLGTRQPEVYGTQTLADIEARVIELGAELGAEVTCAQSNSEGAMVDHVLAARHLDGIVLNPGAYGHYSYALRDAVVAAGVPCVEVHISNVYAREEFRHASATAAVMAGYICGCGVVGYEMALRVVLHRIAQT